MMGILSVSIMPVDFGRLDEEIKTIERAGVPALLMGLSNGTQRSSPQNTCTLSHATVLLNGSCASIPYASLGVVPPDNATLNSPRSFIACIEISANSSAADMLIDL